LEGYTSDHEQAEAIKKWWKENGKSIAAGVTIGIAAVFGWRFWAQHQEHQAHLAAEQYARVVAAQDQPAELQAAAGVLKSRHSGSEYMVMAALVQARSAVQQNQLEDALTHLRFALDQTDSSELQDIVRLRLARVHLALGEREEALRLLDGVEDSSPHAAAYAEVRGDVLLAMDKANEARQAYAKALAGLPPEAGNRELVQMKLNDLATAESGP
jgi:predicted negative regulator of RcsB-dependent stress response